MQRGRASRGRARPEKKKSETGRKEAKGDRKEGKTFHRQLPLERLLRTRNLAERGPALAGCAACCAADDTAGTTDGAPAMGTPAHWVLYRRSVSATRITAASVDAARSSGARTRATRFRC